LTATPTHPILERLDERILGLDQKPQFAWPPTFPEHAFEEVLQKLFSQPGLKLTIHHKGWEEGDAALQGFGEHIQALPFTCAPIKSPLFFLFNQEDLKGLMGEILGGEKIPAPFYDEGVTSGFTNYLALEVLQFIENLKCFAPFSPKLCPQQPDFAEKVKNEPHYVIDVSVKLERRVVWGRIAIPTSFREEWNHEASGFPLPPLTEEQMKKVQLPVQVE